MPHRALPPVGVAPFRSALAIHTDPCEAALLALALARSVGVVARLGLFAELSDDPVEVTDLAHHHGLQVEPLRMMLDLMASVGWLEQRLGSYAISPGARGWLDPNSPCSIVTTLSASLDSWAWWGELDQVVSGAAMTTSTVPDPDDEIAWLRRVGSQFEYARRIGEEFADAIELPHQAQSLLDLGGSHGWYSAVLCKRYPMLRAKVIDAAPVVAIGQELMWQHGMDCVVAHEVGTVFGSGASDPCGSRDLGGPYDAVICTPLIGGHTDEEVLDLLRSIRAALRPGGLLITLRTNHADDDAPAAAAAALDLFLRLTSHEELSSPAQFRTQLSTTGFSAPRTRRLTTAAPLTLYVTRAR
jgi:hypothetical protein